MAFKSVIVVTMKTSHVLALAISVLTAFALVSIISTFKLLSRTLRLRTVVALITSTTMLARRSARTGMNIPLRTPCYGTESEPVVLAVMNNNWLAIMPGSRSSDLAIAA
jgi:hypothetical protein